MGYQEYIIRSNKRSAEECAAFLTNQINNKKLNLEVVGTTKLKEDLSTSKITFLGKSMDINSINLKAGDEFVILAGERASYNLNRIFPFFERGKVDFYTADHIMLSDIAKGREWNDIFIDKLDSEIELTEALKTADEELVSRSETEQLQSSVIKDDLIDTNIGKIPQDDLNDILAIQNGFDSYEEMKASGVYIDNDISPVQANEKYVPSGNLASRMMESENSLLPDLDYSLEIW